MPYHVRVAIDCKINVGHWYQVRGRGSEAPEIRLVEDEPDRPVRLVLFLGLLYIVGHMCSVLRQKNLRMYMRSVRPT